MTTDPAVWLDLTGLLYAPGARPTGIPRVIVHLLQHWIALGLPRLRFCAIRSVQRALVEVDPMAVQARFSMARSPSQTNLLALAQMGFHLLPEETRACLRRSTARLLAPLDRWRKPPIRLGSEDLLVSMGGTWIVHDGGTILHELKQQSGFRHAVFVHDIIPELHPHFYPPSFPPIFRSWAMHTLRAADLVLVNSRHTAGDVRAFCAGHRLPVPAVEILRLGDDFASAEEEPPPGLPADRPFVLSVGTIEARKNHALLYQVWRRLAESRGPESLPLLVFAGAPGWRTGDLLDHIARDPRTRGHIVLLPHVGDAGLRWLYAHCLFTMYPSHYEGWGLPVGESLAAGKYCIASNTSSIPEVGGNLVGLHDPGDLPTCLALVRQALDPAWRQRREERIRRDYVPTTWRNFALQALAVLQRSQHVRSAA